MSPKHFFIDFWKFSVDSLTTLFHPRVLQGTPKVCDADANDEHDPDDDDDNDDDDADAMSPKQFSMDSRNIFYQI